MEIKAFRGLKNTTTPERFAAKGYFDAADNVELDDTGKLLSRLGTTLAAAGSYHSLFSDGDACLVMSGQDLKRVNADYSTDPLARLTTARRVSYSRQQNTIYLSNGVDRGRVTSSGFGEWGIRQPLGQPFASATGGSLPPGRYQYALTFRRASGQEGGTGVSGLVELSERGGVQFSSIEVPTDPEVADKCLYLSGPNGEELFRLAVLAPGEATYAYRGSGSDLTVRLETQFDNPPPPGDIVECHNGVMYCVSGSVAWHSKPYQFERFCHRDQFLQFPGPVGLFAAVNDGIFVSAGDVTWFLEGKGPGDFRSRVVFDYGAIPGTSARTTMGALKLESEAPEGAPSGAAVVWATSRGICFGTDGGQAINMTERTFSLPSARSGAGVVRQARGMTQYLVALEGAQVPASDGA